MGLINLYKKLKLNKLIGKAVDKPELLRSAKWWAELYKTLWGIKEVRTMFAGYKSYIVAALAAAVTVLHSLGYIDDATRDMLLGLLGAGAIGTVAAKINRIEKKTDDRIVR